jgi:VWFA-related protein
VDVVVADGANRIRSGLAPRDFRLYEDGVLQTLDSVQFLTTAPGEVSSKEEAALSAPSGMLITETATQETRVGPWPEPYRYTVILLDLASMDVAARVRILDALHGWFHDDLPPRTRVAVFALTPSFGPLTPFTDNRTRLAQAIEKVRHYQSTFAAAGADLLRALVTEPFVTGAEEDPSGYQASRILDSLEVAQPELLNNPFTLRIIRAYLTMRDYVERRHAEAVLDALQAVAQGLNSVPGRKLVILVSEGFTAGGFTDRELYRTAETANQSGVSIYVVQPQGLETRGVSSSMAQRGELSELNAESAIVRKDAEAGSTLFDRAKVAGSDMPEAALRYLATSTGGFVVRNTNDLRNGLRNIAREGTAYYLLAYRPSRAEFDGSTRLLKVEVSVPDARVYHQTSYRAIPPGLEALTTEQYLLWRAIQLGERPLGLGVRGNAFLFPALPFANNVAVVIEAPVDSLKFRASPATERAPWQAQLTLDAFLQEASTEVVVWARRVPLDLHLTDEERRILDPLTIGDEFAVPPGEYRLTLLVDDVVGGRSWRHEVNLHVPSPQLRVGLSDLILGKRVEKTGQEQTLLAADSATVVPTLSPDFGSQDRLIYYFRICSGRGEVKDVGVSLFRKEGPGSRRVWHETLPWRREGPLCRPVARWIDLAGLDPGLYFLAVKVTTDDSGEDLERRTSFLVKGETARSGSTLPSNRGKESEDS